MNDSKKLFTDTPREVMVSRLVSERAKEISDLLAVVDNHQLPSGEVCQGPRTFIQRLPRHLRRRAMSHNVKRLPNAQRKCAQRIAADTSHRKKPPSRYHRRRPRNLLQAYIRRQRHHVWLETHIWHAKRFHMRQVWDYNLAERSCQRSFRPSYRDSVKHCTVQDISFTSCLELSGPFQIVVDGLNQLCNSAVGPTFRYKMALNGTMEVEITLYEPNQYPLGCIGPVTFVWNPTESGSDVRTLWLWLHPAIHDRVKEILKNVFELELVNNDTEESLNVDIKSLKEWQLNKIQMSRDTMINLKTEISLISLKDQLNRFRLIGPLSTNILSHVCQCVDFDNIADVSENWQSLLENEQNVLRDQARFWNSISTVRPSQLPNGTVLSLLVKDPRLAKTTKKQFPTFSTPTFASVDITNIQLHSFLWNSDLRHKVLETKIPDQQFHSLSSSAQEIQPSLIPILLISHNPSKNGNFSGFGSGWDLVFPAGWSMAFWIALQYRTARAVGLSNDRSLAMEIGRIAFPDDWADTAAANELCLQETKELKDKWNRRPYNRRIEYWNRYRIKYPFELPWKELIAGWTKDESVDNFYVLRDRKSLRHVAESLRGKIKLDQRLVETHSRSLVLVRLIPVDRNCPKRFSVICLPNSEDLLPKSPDTHVLEPLAKKLKTDTEPEVETKVNKNSELGEFISFSDEEEVDLQSLFVDKEKLKREHKKLKKKEKRKGKSSKNRPESIDCSINIVSSCSRPVVGLVVRGDFSFARGQGFGLGYCSLVGLKSLLDCNMKGVTKVLFRNTTCDHYRIAHVEAVLL